MAGIWGDVEKVGVAAYCGAFQAMFALKREFTAGADGSVDDWVVDEVKPAFLADIGVKFDSGTPPSSLTVTIKDLDGLQVAQETFAESGRLTIDDRPSLIGGATISISGNTTNGAKAKIILNFANNLR